MDEEDESAGGFLRSAGFSRRERHREGDAQVAELIDLRHPELRVARIDVVPPGDELAIPAAAVRCQVLDAPDSLPVDRSREIRLAIIEAEEDRASAVVPFVAEGELEGLGKAELLLLDAQLFDERGVAVAGGGERSRCVRLCRCGVGAGAVLTVRLNVDLPSLAEHLARDRLDNATAEVRAAPALLRFPAGKELVVERWPVPMAAVALVARGIADPGEVVLIAVHHGVERFAEPGAAAPASFAIMVHHARRRVDQCLL